MNTKLTSEQNLHNRLDREKQMTDAALLELNEKFDTLKAEVTKNTTVTNESNQDIKQLLELFQAAKGGFKVMGWFGVFAKWVSGLVGLFALLYAFVQNVRGLK